MKRTRHKKTKPRVKQRTKPRSKHPAPKPPVKPVPPPAAPPTKPKPPLTLDTAAQVLTTAHIAAIAQRVKDGGQDAVKLWEFNALQRHLRAAKPKWNARDAMRAHRDRHPDIIIPACRDPKRRTACTRDLEKFIATYFKRWFPHPHSPDQLDNIATLQRVFLEGGSFADASPRGWGKTQRTKAAVIWATLYGHTRYCVPFAATAKAAKKLLEKITQAFADNPTLAADFPEICLPIRTAYAKPNRAKYLTVKSYDAPTDAPNEPARLVCSTAKLVFPSYSRVDPATRGTVIECSGLLEAARGLQHDTTDGHTLRPDSAIGDDFQTRKSAASATQCQQRLDTIAGDIKYLAGPDKELRMVVNCTVIKRGDAADQLVDRKKHPEFHGVRKKFIYDWPTPAGQKLWAEYTRLRQQDQRDGDRLGKTANAFYAANREAMDAGAVTGWEHGYRPAAGELSTLQSAYNRIADDGQEAFDAECQNDPKEKNTIAIRLTADHILARANGLAIGEIKPETACITGFIDLNDHALAWTLAGYNRDLAGHIAHYGEYPDPKSGERIWDETWKDTDPRKRQGKEQRFWNALDQLVPKLLAPGLLTKAGQPAIPDLILIDSNYLKDLVLKWIRAYNLRGGANVMPSRGSPSRYFRQRSTDADITKWGNDSWWFVEQKKIAETLTVARLVHDADYHRREMQLAWLLSPHSPKSLTIYGNLTATGRDPQHLWYAQQVASEKLTQYADPDGPRYSGLYQWDRTPGIRNEMGDCATGTRAAAIYFLNATGKIVLAESTDTTSASPLHTGGEDQGEGERQTQTHPNPQPHPPAPVRRQTTGWETW